MAIVSVAEEYGFNFAEETCVELPWRKFPCRKCITCLLNRQKAWVSRLVEELRNHETNYFVTLTYSDEFLPFDENGEPAVWKPHIKKLNADMRKRFQQGKLRNPVSDIILGSPEFLELPDIHYQYYITSEYGPSTQRPHYHGVWYGLDLDQSLAEVLFRTLWPYGFVSVFPAKEGAAGYISKYLVTDGVGKDSYHGNGTPPFSLMSKGLGKEYAVRMGAWHRADPRRMYTQYHGSKGTMDRYLKKKIFTPEVLQEYADKTTLEHEEKRLKYAYFQSEHPALYRQLMAERQKYFEDMKTSIQWNILKKHNLK